MCRTKNYLHPEKKAKLVTNSVANVFILITATQTTDSLFPKLSCTQLLKKN